MKLKEMKTGISNKKGYKYVWDEATKFLIYKNDKEDLIFGLSTRGDQIEEAEILKLYKISLKGFRILLDGDATNFRFEHTIYPKNFCSLVNEEAEKSKVTDIVNYLGPVGYYSYDQFKEAEEFNYDIELRRGKSFFRGNSGENAPMYFDFPRENQEEINKMVHKVLQEILGFLYSIGRKRYWVNYEKFQEDYSNHRLARDIHNNYFVYDKFDIIEDRESDSSKIYEKALDENKLYDEYVELLDTFIEKNVNCTDTSEDHTKASQIAISYKRITGKNYNFKNKILEKVYEEK